MTPQADSLPETPPATGSWLLRNGITVLLAAAALFWLYNRFGIEGLISILEAAVGLGFVVFIHELGHFAVAKWCDVHVETFSIGFGPAIPGCSFRRGETLYKIAWFPLGGYVKMVGEGTEEDGDEDDPRSFKNKPVWQRMCIISAGVTMNVLFGFACFIFVYMTHGAERLAGVVGQVEAGSPAWQKGIRSESRIVQINNVHNPYFDDVLPQVMTTWRGDKVRFTYEPPDSKGPPVTVEVAPRREKDEMKPAIGIGRPSELKLFPKVGKELFKPVVETSAAAQASPAFDFGDTIVGTTDPDHPDQTKSIDIKDAYDFQRRLKQLAGREVIIQVRRSKAGPSDPPVDIKVPPAYHYGFGLRMRMGHIVAVRQDSPAARAGIEVRNQDQGVEGDILKEVEVTEPDGKKLRFVSSRKDAPATPNLIIKDLDPLRLPDELDQWALRQKTNREVTLTVVRPVKHADRQTVTLKAQWDDRWRYDMEVPISFVSPIAVHGLGLAYRVETVVDAVAEGTPAAEAGIKPGDVIKAIQFRYPGKKPGETKPSKWLDLEYDQWAYVSHYLQENAEFKEVTLRVEHEGETKELVVTAVEDRTWPLADRGLHLMPDFRIQKADNFGSAVAMGVDRTVDSIKQIYQTLVALVTGLISPKLVGGPLAIAEMAYYSAGDNVYAFLVFLGIISVNLAVINFLPVPVLDGGHMVFLIYEAVRGKAASEQVRIAATYVGLVLLLSLMVIIFFFVDLSRHF
jgi:regulator of sigma E protease